MGKSEISCDSIGVPCAFTCPIFAQQGAHPAFPGSHHGWAGSCILLTWSFMLGKCAPKPLKSTGQTRAWQTLSKILALSEVCGKLSLGKGVFLTALVSMGSPGDTSSPLVPALLALKLSWEAKAWKVEILDTVEKLAEVSAFYGCSRHTGRRNSMCNAFVS